ncbi:hypothetical protein J19TS2_01210 [Cohnella xylanilytica]|uniref:PilZ domain-containing protein n=1 Tax=Cohnella xylanilytica TaxID=557555 RepID=UPI001B2B17F4|nr:PilZ domain-containing protein [Cohnella xylanilytica]GIO10566.1 hypothetical protein J19TS2_01210 [Cohnella xylanilytica]
MNPMEVMEAEHPYSRRRHVRLRLPADQRAEIRIIAIGQVDLTSPPGFVRLLNVSEGGCCCGSDLRFPVHPRVLMEMRWTFEDRTIALAGKIVWREQEEGGYRYGVQFVMTPLQRSNLIGHLNAVLLSLCPGQSRIHALYRQMTFVPYQMKNEEAPS